MSEVFRLASSIMLKTDEAINGLKNVSKQANDADKQTEGFANKFGNGILKVGNLVKVVMGAAVTKFGLDCIKAAAELDQINKKADVIFGEMSDGVKQFAVENEKTFGLGSGTITKYMNSVADLAQGVGMAKDESVKFATEAVDLGTKLANWNNIDAGAAIDDINKAVMGSTKSVEKYGIKLNEATLNEATRKAGLGGSFSALNEVQKMQVRYNAIMDASANAIDYWNDGNRSLTQQLNYAKEMWGNITEVIGNFFLPIAMKVLKWFTDGMQKVSDWANSLDTSFSWVSDAFYVMGDNFKDVVSVFESIFLYMYDSIVEPILGLMGDKTISFSEIADYVFNFISDIFITFGTVLKNVWENLGKPVFDFIIDMVWAVYDIWAKHWPAIQEIFQMVSKDIKNMWENYISPALKALGDFIQNVLGPVFKWLLDNIIGPVFRGILETIRSTWTNSIKPIFEGICKFVEGVFSGNWKKAWEGVVKIFSGIFSGLAGILKAPLNAVIGIINNVIDKINSVKVDIPSWIPGVGGKSFGLSIKHMNYLEDGGILTRPTMIAGNVMAGEKNQGRSSQAEVVTPLDELKKWIMSLATRPVEISIDGRTIMKATAPYQDEFEKFNQTRDPRYGY